MPLLLQQPHFSTNALRETYADATAAAVIEDVIRVFDRDRDGYVTEDEALDVFQSEPAYDSINRLELLAIFGWKPVPFLDRSCTLLSAELPCDATWERYQEDLRNEDRRVAAARDVLTSLQYFLGWRGKEIYPIETTLAFAPTAVQNPVLRVTSQLSVVRSIRDDVVVALDDIKASLSDDMHSHLSNGTQCAVGEDIVKMERKFAAAHENLEIFEANIDVLYSQLNDLNDDNEPVSDPETVTMWIEASLRYHDCVDIELELISLEQKFRAGTACEDVSP